MELVNRDTKIVSKQLGRKIKNRFWVVKYCRYNYPMVIKTDPIGPDGPFPTLFWLTCPFLKKEIGKLESLGHIKKYQELLNTNPGLRMDYLLAHYKTRELRLNLAKELHPEIDLLNPLFSSLFNGIGGMLNLESIKCLHLQVANYLGGVVNPIGEAVLKELRDIYCDNRFCAKYEFENSTFND